MDIKHDYTISLIRFLAMIFIIACHIMQYYQCALAWWFNVGVQIFLCISGYLYGRKKEIDDIKFYFKNFKKIYIGFLVVLIPFAVISYIRKTASALIILKSLLCVGKIPGGEHLWFIPTILLCYFLTPFFFRYFDKAALKNKMILSYLALMGLLFLVISLFTKHFYAAWISCYATGFFLARLTKMKKQYKLVCNLIITFMIIANFAYILIEYVYKLKFEGAMKTLYTYYCEYTHLLLGVALFILLKKVFDSININDERYFHIHKLLKVSDKYSYEVYLIHQFLILGPLSMLKLTTVASLNIVIALICIFLLAYLANKISSYILLCLNKIILKLIK